MTGKIVMTDTKKILDLSTVQAGVYMVRITTGDKIAQQYIVKK